MVKADAKIDLAEKTKLQGANMRKILGVILIMTTNLTGLAIIVRIWSKGD